MRLTDGAADVVPMCLIVLQVHSTGSHSTAWAHINTAHARSTLQDEEAGELKTVT